MRFEVLMAVKIRIVVFWVMAPCGLVVGYQCLRNVLPPSSE